LTNISEEHIASFFRTEEKAEQKSSIESKWLACHFLQALLDTFHAGFSLGFFFSPEDGGNMFV
jgi:hypothetical protein